MREADLTDLPEIVRARYQSLYPGLADKLKRFDARLYFASNPDVARAAGTSDDLVSHFCEFGHRECRLYAPGVTYAELYAEAFPHLADKLRQFDPMEYWRANRDVAGPTSNVRELFEHYCRHGADELRVTRDDGRIADRRAAFRHVMGRHMDYDIRVYAHIFFPEQGRALVPYLRNMTALGARVALSFSGVTFSPQEMEAYAVSISAEGNPDAEFVTAPSTGRDWGGFYRLWQTSPPLAGSAVFLMHSKKSQHLAPVIGAMWRNELLGPLCGSYGAVLGTVDKLESGHTMVASALHKSRNIGPSRELILELLPRLRLPRSVLEREFCDGAMFAIRGSVLSDFFTALDGALDFGRQSTNASPFDGSMAHACERLIGYFAASRGDGIAWAI